MADAHSTFDPTAWEEAINAVQAIAETIQVFGFSRHDAYPTDALAWIGGHLIDAGETLRGQFRAYCREQRGG
ncbi:MAG: hypothetical protein NVV74_17800 [Magnetospirillum sp.]|nr:hypothetical protein [Magnetospirillum sp.]